MAAGGGDVVVVGWYCLIFILFFFSLKEKKQTQTQAARSDNPLGKGDSCWGGGGGKEVIERGIREREEGSWVSGCVGARGMPCPGEHREISLLMRQNARGRALFPTYLPKLHPCYPHAGFWRASLLAVQLITVFP